MTIAVCYVAPEGVVFGADSTTTITTQSGQHYYDHGQKILEIGERSTLGIANWGLSGGGMKAHRQLVAELADDLVSAPAATVLEAMERWIDLFWTEYSSSKLIQSYLAALRKSPFDPKAVQPSEDARTEDEEALANMNLGAGFCLGGYVLPDRTPTAFHVWFDGRKTKPSPSPVPMNDPRYFGAPNYVLRLIDGCDPGFRRAILASGKWSGTEQDLIELLREFALGRPDALPIRDVVDFVHSSILSTIKALKFSHLSQICGGPIELAVITSDRQFRWVRHKPWDSAVADGDL